MDSGASQYDDSASVHRPGDPCILHRGILKQHPSPSRAAFNTSTQRTQPGMHHTLSDGPRNRIDSKLDEKRDTPRSPYSCVQRQSSFKVPAHGTRLISARTSGGKPIVVALAGWARQWRLAGCLFHATPYLFKFYSHSSRLVALVHSTRKHAEISCCDSVRTCMYCGMGACWTGFYVMPCQ